MSKAIGRVYKCEVCGSTFEPWRLTQRTCSKSCSKTGSRNNSFKHGHSRKGKQSRAASIWYGMRNRVKNPDSYHKKYYDNVNICERWDSFENFLADMGEPPSDKHSLDRIDVYGDYEPGNCRWATHQEQMNNTTSNKLLTLNGVTMTQEEWGRSIGLNGTTICKRLKRGWPLEKALTAGRVPTGHKTV